jgi:hypothetical protein
MVETLYLYQAKKIVPKSIVQIKDQSNNKPKSILFYAPKLDLF